MINSPIDQIKERLDIVDVIKGYIKVHKAGVNYRAACPFHNEKKGSFFISPTKQIWHCFGACSEGGDIFKFVMKIEGIEFGDALRVLAQKAGVELKKESPEFAKLRTEKQRLYEVTNLACEFFQTQLQQSAVGQEAKKYLLGRGMTEESILKWRIGYAPDVWQGLFNFLSGRGYDGKEVEKVGLAISSKGRYFDRFRGRIMFPIFDLSSQVVGFGGRVFKQTKRHDGQEEAKYINSPATVLYDKSKTLYGLNKAGIDIRKKDKCVLVEGYMDVIMANQVELENVVSTSGTALTSDQLRILKRYTDNLLTAFDMDLAGNSATKRGIDLAQAEGFNIKIVTMPEGKDPADVALEGVEEFQKLFDGAKSIHDFYFESTFAKFDKSTMDGKREISKLLLPVIKKIPNKIEQTIWVQSLANGLGVREEVVLEELEKTKYEESQFSKEKEHEPEIKKKTRRELLEERLIALIIKDPKKMDLIDQEALGFFSLDSVNILDIIKKGEKDEKIDHLFLKAEVELVDLDFEQEFQECFRNLKKLVLDDKRINISRGLKEAEQNKDSEKEEEYLKKHYNTINHGEEKRNIKNEENGSQKESDSKESSQEDSGQKDS